MSAHQGQEYRVFVHPVRGERQILAKSLYTTDVLGLFRSANISEKKYFSTG